MPWALFATLPADCSAVVEQEVKETRYRTVQRMKIVFIVDLSLIGLWSIGLVRLFSIFWLIDTS